MGILEKLFGSRATHTPRPSPPFPAGNSGARQPSASSSLSPASEDPPSSGAESREPEEVSADEVRRRLAGPEPPLLLDVREIQELRAHGSIPGRLHIPMGHLPLRLADLDPAKPVIVYCAHGMRSYDVACLLLDEGFRDVANLKGGFAAWPGDVHREG